MNNRLIKIMAGAAAVVAIALGGMAIGRTGSGSSASATGNGGFPGARGGAQGAPGQGFRGGGPGGGTAVTGTAASKVKAAALAKYPGATIEQVLQLPDGSYVAHVFTTSGEVHLLVSKAFKVTGTAQRGGPPGAQGAPPQGAAPQGGTTTAPSNSQTS
jgi:hypothetical protein